MHINWIAYYMDYDGYGRWNSRLVKALQTLGISVKPATMDSLSMPGWMQEQEGIDFSQLTISSLPPYYLKPVPGRHWLLSMVEGTKVPEEWVKTINESGVERMLVPCTHNRKAFLDSGVQVPISVLPGGTDPAEFPVAKRVYTGEYNRAYPYTFLTIADRGFRKGWEEVWKAFYLAFGGKTTGRQDVRLIIKCRPKAGNTTVDWMAKSEGSDKRIFYQVTDPEDMYNVYRQADCLVLPSRCEGWGMPHREAACMGLPVITQQYSGMDDGDTDKWAMVLKKGTIQPVPKENKLSLGEWKVCDVKELADFMFYCYENPDKASQFGLEASSWIRDNQTWLDSARTLVGCITIVNEKERWDNVIQMDSRPLHV